MQHNTCNTFKFYFDKSKQKLQNLRKINSYIKATKAEKGSKTLLASQHIFLNQV